MLPGATRCWPRGRICAAQRGSAYGTRPGASEISRTFGSASAPVANRHRGPRLRRSPETTSVVTDEDACASAIADGSERDAIVSRQARPGPSASLTARVAAGEQSGVGRGGRGGVDDPPNCRSSSSGCSLSSVRSRSRHCAATCGVAASWRRAGPPSRCSRLRASATRCRRPARRRAGARGQRAGRAPRATRRDRRSRAPAPARAASGR
jgi:hypothetical protein